MTSASAPASRGQSSQKDHMDEMPPTWEAMSVLVKAIMAAIMEKTIR
jgi:hypothetical protein